jgi:SAM-dependent methyltransferase
VPTGDGNVADELRFYGELAEWWPLISPPGDYAEEAAYAATLLRSGDRRVETVLELGSGGGHNAVHLKADFALTLVDRSPGMLAMSEQLNPECEHQVGDMRSVRLDREFDAVFVHDAVQYLTTEADLVAAVETVFVHLRPGGVAVLMPDEIRETCETGADHGGTDGDDGRGVRYLEWTWDPDPDDDSYCTEYVFLLREVDGTVRAVHETHQLGLFPEARWLAILRAAGLEPRAITEVTTEDRPPRRVFVARKPGSAVD